MELQGETAEPLGHEVWALLTREEAFELLEALQHWVTDSQEDPDWHVHLGEGDSQLTLAIKPTRQPEEDSCRKTGTSSGRTRRTAV